MARPCSSVALKTSSGMICESVEGEANSPSRATYFAPLVSHIANGNANACRRARRRPSTVELSRFRYVHVR